MIILTDGINSVELKGLSFGDKLEAKLLQEKGTDAVAPSDSTPDLITGNWSFVIRGETFVKLVALLQSSIGKILDATDTYNNRSIVICPIEYYYEVSHKRPLTRTETDSVTKNPTLLPGIETQRCSYTVSLNFAVIQVLPLLEEEA